MKLYKSMNDYPLLISNLYRILMTTCNNKLCELNKLSNIGLTQTYSIYFNSAFISLSIIYIDSNSSTFTKVLNSTIKLIKYKMFPLNKLLFSLQNIYVTKSKSISSNYKHI
jgi:hypothetical protein